MLKFKNYVEEEQEYIFKNRPLLKEKYNRYRQEFENLFPYVDIMNKDYKTTLIRNLIMYFLYQEKNKRGNYNKLTLDQLAKLFELKSHSAVIYGIKKIEMFIQKPRYLTKDKETFFFLYYKYNQIFNISTITHSKITNEINNSRKTITSKTLCKCSS